VSTKALVTFSSLLICAVAGAQSSQEPATASVSIGPGLAVRFVDRNNERQKTRVRKSAMQLSPGHYVVGIVYVGALAADSRICELEFDVAVDRAYIIVPHRSAGAWGASLRSHAAGQDGREVVDRRFDPLVDIECKFELNEETEP
jgi:hypothetical protein